MKHKDKMISFLQCGCEICMYNYNKLQKGNKYKHNTKVIFREKIKEFNENN